MNRPKQTDCRYEPGYPEHTTVVFVLSAPDMTAHSITDRCRIEQPHLIHDCGEFNEEENMKNLLLNHR